MLLSKVKETIMKYGMFDPIDRVLVAVSGGPDSVCLMSVLHSLSPEFDLTLHIAHLDHMFRGRESAEEALFVAALAKTSGISATVEKFDVPAYCAERGLSAQAGAREVRYAFLNRVAGEVCASRIALGHTASDQAETFLMRLMRGAGAAGLSAIPPVRGNIIRPLIECTRDEVMDYLRRTGLEFVSDSSNLKPFYTRNRVRSELMPALKKFNPAVETALAGAAALLRDEDRAMEEQVMRIAPQVMTRERGELYLKRDGFNALPRALKRRILRKAADMVGLRATLSSVQIEDALGFMSAARTGRAMQVLPQFIIERQYDRFLLRTDDKPAPYRIALVVPGVTTVPEAGVQVETEVSYGRPAGHDEKNYFWQAAFDYDKIALPLFLRSRRPGDRFCPAGMAGKSKKLQDYLVDEKVPRLSRDAVPILSTRDAILWVVGHRTDGRFLPTDETRKALVVRVKRLSD